MRVHFVLAGHTKLFGTFLPYKTTLVLEPTHNIAYEHEINFSGGACCDVWHGGMQSLFTLKLI